MFPEKWDYKNSSFWHFNSHFVLKTTKTPVFVFITEIFWRTFWRNNWQSMFDIVERLCLYFFFRKSWNWKDLKFFEVQFGPVVNFSTTKKASSTLLLFFGLEVWGSENSEDAKEICLEISCCGQAPSYSEQRKLVNIHAFLLSFS